MALFGVRNLFGTKSAGPRKTRRQRPDLLAELLEDRTLLSSTSALQQAYGQLPLSFEVNKGQTASQVQYLSRGSGYALFLTENSAVLNLTQASASAADTTSPPASTTGVALAMNLVGANPRATVSGLDQQSGVSNYLIGNNPSQWHTDVANYGKVEYQGVYPGINLVYYGNQQQLEYDFVVAPGANPSNIQLDFQGASSISLDAQGDLVLHTASGNVLQHAPVIYQEVGGVRETVSGKFVLGGQGRVHFQVGPYNASLPLTIDPVLSYSTYLGADSLNIGQGIAVDSSGNAYITGYTISDIFPTTTGSYQTVHADDNGNYDVFVTELNSAGTALVYSTYLGGNNSDLARGIALDSSGDAYVTGYTFSTNFPTSPGAFQTSFGGSNEDAFVTELNPSGAALVYSTYLGGSGEDQARHITVDSLGNAYVTGTTSSTDFPTTAGALQTSHASDSGNFDAFVTKLNASGTALVYSTYLGGSQGDAGYGIAVDGSGDAFVTGATSSTDFPTTAGALQTNLGGSGDAFVSELNATGTALVYSTFLGGTNNDGGFGIALDGSGDAYVTGFSFSTDFPTTAGAFQTGSGGSEDAFVIKLNASGTALVYSTYLGGSSNDYGNGIALDGFGNAYLTGYTFSTNFPTTTDAFQSTLGGTENAFVIKLNPDGAALVYSTYLGGNGYDAGLSIAVDSSGNAYIIGYTNSANFPTTTGAFQTSIGGMEDAFIAKFDFSAAPPPSIIGVVINQNISALYNAVGQPFAGAQRSMVDDIVYTFSEPVNILAPGIDPNVFTIAVASGWTGTVPTLSWAPVAGSNDTQWAVTFSGASVTGGSIANGSYTITVNDPASITAQSDDQAVNLTDSGIGAATQSFYRLFGDINGDKFVNAADNAKFKNALTTYNAAFDYNGDGVVNAFDNAKFKNDLTVTFSGFTPTI